jgi:hypothetical protein
MNHDAVVVPEGWLIRAQPQRTDVHFVPTLR